VHLRKHSPGSGFTLIELLAVVALVLLLLSILVPLVGQARRRADLIPCLSNLRQLYTVCVGYAQEYNKQLPMGLSENPFQLSTRTNYTDFARLNAYMKDLGHSPTVWYCPSLPKNRCGDVTAWGDSSYGGSGKPGSTGTPGEFPIGYFYVGNVTRTAEWKFDVLPPRTLDDLMRSGVALAWDYCRAFRPSPELAVDVSNWDIFPHHGTMNPAVCQMLMGNGSVQRKPITELQQRFHYIAPIEVYW